MEIVTWLRALSKNNDPNSAPNHPFPVRFGDVAYIYSTDKLVLAIANVNTVPELIKEPCPLQQELYKSVVEQMLEAQKTAKSIGVIDVLSLKEMAGEANWDDDIASRLRDEDHPMLLIGGCHYNKPVLARALEAWTEPLATAFLCNLFKNKKAQALMIASENMLVLCMPVRPLDDLPLEDVTPIPEWMLVPVE